LAASKVKKLLTAEIAENGRGKRGEKSGWAELKEKPGSDDPGFFVAQVSPTISLSLT
jgi:hypothetical protein